MFSQTGRRRNKEDWHGVARTLVGRFRADAARAGASAEIAKLVEELSALSPVFKDLWNENEIAGHGEGTKRLHHDRLGRIEMEFSTFSVEGRSDLTLMIYTPATDETAERIRSYLAKA